MTIGLDLGGDQLRIAVSKDKGAVSVAHYLSNERLFRTVRRLERGSDTGAPHYEIVSLKRLLDFDSTVRLPSGAVNSVEYLAGLIRDALRSCDIGPVKDENCVVAVPAYFSERQRSAVMQAVRLSGCGCVKLVNETKAAFLAALDKFKSAESVLVYGWGASIFSTALYRLRDGVPEIVRQEGDCALGGDDIDAMIVSYVLDTVFPHAGVPRRGDDWRLGNRLLVESEKAKVAVAAGQSASIPWARLAGEGVAAPPGLSRIDIPASVCQTAILAMVARTMELVDKVLSEANCPQPSAVLAVGGTTLMPAVRNALGHRFTVRIEQADADAVARGAVLYGLSLKPEEWKEAAQPAGPARPGKEANGDARIAVALSPQASPQQPEGGSGLTNVITLLNKLERQAAQGHTEESFGTFDEIIEQLNSYRIFLFRQLAKERINKGDRPGGIAILDRANRLDSSNRWIAFDLARTSYEQAEAEFAAGRFRDALKTAERGSKAMELLPGARKTYLSLVAGLLHLRAHILCELGQTGQAERLAYQLIQIDPDNRVFQESLRKIKELHRKPVSRKSGRSGRKH